MSKFLSACLFFAVVLSDQWKGTEARVPLEEFFPYGVSVGDTRVPTADDNFVQHNLTQGHRVYFFDQGYDQLFINNNGGVSFVRGVFQFTPTCGPQDTPMIVPFWADVDTRNGGRVWYRESSDAAVLAKATREIRSAFPDLPVGFNIMRTFIVTWDQVAFFGSGGCGSNALSKRNNFQSVISLGNEGTQTFIIFNYERINWITGTASGGNCSGRGGTPAKAGFDTGDRVNFYSLPGTCTEGVDEIVDKTNVNRPGRWIFRIDEEEIEEPTHVPTTEDSDRITTGQPEVPTTEQPEVPTTGQPEVPTTEQPEEPTTYQPEIPTTEDGRFPTTGQPEIPTTSNPAECDPHDCSLQGDCFQYAQCDAESHTYRYHNCSDDLYWNPHNNSAIEYFNDKGDSRQYQHAHHTHESGQCHGSCDVWENLSPEVQQRYLQDEACFPTCTYREIGDCSNSYYFHPHDTDARNFETLHCPIDTRYGRNIHLLWDQERQTCDFCYNTFRQGDAQPCCETYDILVLPQGNGAETETQPGPDTDLAFAVDSLQYENAKAEKAEKVANYEDYKRA